MNGFKLWGQLTSNYTDMMQEAMDQTWRVWHVPPPEMKAEKATPGIHKNGNGVYHHEHEAHETEEIAPEGAPPPIEEEEQQVWTYRGYHLEGGNFTNAMVHFFRAQTARADQWRTRLDTTTNWAVITTAATLSLAWDPRVIILNTLLITLFLYIEARRYRYYELWSYRVRLMETDFFAAMLVPPFRPACDWAESLAESLLQPSFPVSMWEAFGRRLRNNYVWIYTILWIAWLLSNWLHPEPVGSWVEFLERASIGGIPGWAILLTGIGFNSVLVVIGLFTMQMQDASGEVLPRDGIFPFFSGGHHAPSGDRWNQHNPPRRRRQQVMATIITAQPQPVSKQIQHAMGRSVTTMQGTNGNQSQAVLLCALTITEVSRLKVTVNTVDPQAIITVLPAHEVQGVGENSLHQWDLTPSMEP